MSTSLYSRGYATDFAVFKSLALESAEMESITLIKTSVSSQPLSISFWVLLTPAHDA